MAWYVCKCGANMRNTMAPNDIELTVFTDREWDDIINIGTLDSGDLPDPKYDVWRCQQCERIYVLDGLRIIKYYVLHSLDELKGETT